MDSDGLSQLSSLIYNDFKNVNNTISEAYDKANVAYDSVSAAYNKANNAYNKANNAYNKANSAYNSASSTRYLAYDAYDQANNAYNQANSAYDKANSAYDLAINGGSGGSSGSDDSYIYYNTQSVFYLSFESMLGFPVYYIQANIPLSYFEYKPHSVSFTFKSNSIYNTTYTSQGVTGFVFEPIHQQQVEDGYGTASSSYIPLYVNTNDYSFRIENASFKFTK